MNFKRKKINNKKPKTPRTKIDIKQFLKKFTHLKQRKYKISLSIGASLLILLILISGIAKAIKSIDFTYFLSVAGEELQKDENGKTNFLILGTGGKNHDGSDLTDTILVASLDNEKKLVSMLSIPRDFYVETEIYDSKINEVLYQAKKHFGSEQQGLMFLKAEIEKILDTKIQYYVKIDFEGFKEFVDAIGGVDIYVENAIYDPKYPKDGTRNYETFKIAAGQHHMDGELALKYARSRKSTSDFDRAKRQQEIIFAIKEKTLETEIIFDQEKINKILQSIKNNISTNIQAKEILTLGSMASDYSKDKIIQNVLKDDPNMCGGFLYTPSRDLYGGMFVLIPAGGYDYIHKFVNLIFNYQEVIQEETKIHILNGTKQAYIAGGTKQLFKKLCLNVVRHGNAASQDKKTTSYYYKQKFDQEGNKIDSRPKTLDYLQTIIPGEEKTIIPEEYKEYLLEADLIIELGSDYVESENYLDDPVDLIPYYYSPPAATPSTETTTTPVNNAISNFNSTTE